MLGNRRVATQGDDATPVISVVVVTYNSRELAPDALDSALAAAKSAGLAAELIVVDNASQDGSADGLAATYPQAIIVRNELNVGFGAANNSAFERARGLRWLLINPDATLEPESLGRLMRALDDDPRLAAVGPSIWGAGTGGAETAGELPGLRALAAHFLFLNRLLPGDRGGPWRGWQLRKRPGPGVRPVSWLSGAVMLVRPEAIRAVGGFDPTIFLHAEDIDLGDRLSRAGWKLALVPTAIAWHALGRSQESASVGWIGALDRYLARRRRSSLGRRTALFVIGVGLALRALAAAHGRDQAHALRMRAGAVAALRRVVSLPPPAPQGDR
jgi:GT2 family glycosyltransferase